MAKKLYYFDFNGIAESIRYILHYTGQKFEDVRYDHGSWPIKNIKDSLPYGQLPKYEEDGKILTQSLAIARYVAAKTPLMPDDLWEQAVADSAAHNVFDFYYPNVVPYVSEKDPVKKAGMLKKIKDELIDFYFSRFERDLKANGGYFTGKLSWAEFVLLGQIESTNLFLNMEVEKDYPTVKRVVDEIRSAPGVKKYISSRNTYYAPI